MRVTAPESARDRRSREMSLDLGQLIVATTRDAFEDLEPRFKALEKQWLASATSRFERLEIRRRIAETLYTEAFGNNCPWPVFGRALRRIQRLGYTDVERRYHVAALYALWCRTHPEHDSRQARRLLDEAERRILRLPKEHFRRKELLARLPGLRARTGFQVERHALHPEGRKPTARR